MSLAFTQMANSLENFSENVKSTLITQEQYQDFLRHWTFYALREWRFGQAFCEHFNIEHKTACPLYHFKCNTFSESWIKDHYLQDSV